MHCNMTQASNQIQVGLEFRLMQCRGVLEFLHVKKQAPPPINMSYTFLGKMGTAYETVPNVFGSITERGRG